jgi:16S rRNA (guanine527-N7)-methyltransferase
MLKVDGYFIAYKLDDKDEIKSAKKALSRLSATIEVIKNYQILGQDRTLIFIKKNAPTQRKYPRANGIPLKEPIR